MGTAESKDIPKAKTASIQRFMNFREIQERSVKGHILSVTRSSSI